MITDKLFYEIAVPQSFIMSGNTVSINSDGLTMLSLKKQIGVKPSFFIFEADSEQDLMNTLKYL